MVTIPSTQNVPIDSLRVDGKNPNVMSKKQEQALKDNITRFGFLIPIVTNKEFVIADGQHRWEAAKALGMSEVPVIAIPVSEVDRKILRQVMNKLRGEHDLDLDIAEYKDIFSLGGQEDLQLLLAFKDKEFQQVKDYVRELPSGDADGVPDVVEERCHLGDLWQLGRHRLLCGDCTVKENFAVLMGGEVASMLFTDPPYGVDYASKNRFLNAAGKGNAVQEPILGDAENIPDMKVFWVNSLKNALVVSSDGAAYYICSPQGGELMMMMAIVEAGWELKHSVIWVKNNHVIGRSDYHYQHEPVLYGWKAGGHQFYGSHSETSVWQIDKPLKSNLHPTMKPVELVSRAIRNSSKDNDIIIDPFLGSGTTIIAAELNNRRCYGMELSPHYCSVIIKRWEDLTGQKGVRL